MGSRLRSVQIPSRAARACFQPVVMEPSMRRAGGALVGGFAAVCFPGAGAFVFDVADGQPQQLDNGVVAGEVATVLDLCPLRDGLWLSPGEVDLASALEPLGEELPGNAVLAFHGRELLF